MKMNVLQIATVFIAFVYLSSYINNKTDSESDLSAKVGSYLGQEQPGTEPTLFAPGFISTDAYEFTSTFSPDGKEFYFTRRPDDKGFANRIYFTKMENGTWTTPSMAPFATTNFEFDPNISPDGSKLYFVSSRPKPPGFSGTGELWSVERTNSGWEKPQIVNSRINDKFAMYATSTINGTIYFTGHRKNKFQILRTEYVDGKFLKPKPLPKEINGMNGVAHPYIAPDESYLLFDARPEEMNKPSLFISFRKSDGSWTEAQKLNSNINATNTEMYPSISPDGKYLFFSRNGDIYWVDAGFIEELKKDKFFPA